MPPADEPASRNARPAHDPYAALRIPSVSLYLSGNIVASIGFLMKDTAISWEVYARTGSKAQLGLVGLLQALPVLTLPLISGHLADRFDRKRIVAISLVLLAITAIMLAINSLWIGSMEVIYGCLFFHGIVRAIQQPARQSILPQISTPEAFPNAVTWGSGGFQFAQVLGPVAATLFIAHMGSAWVVYATYAALLAVFFVMLFWVDYRHPKTSGEAITFQTVVSGASFLFRNNMLLTVMSIDLFAVLLGGATGLMPVFQKDILHVDVEWLGWLRAAPAIGSVIMSIWIAHRPPFRRAGRAMLWSVAGFAVAMIGLGLSEVLWLTMLMLIISGACDIISVVIRHTMVQTLTPDAMRGRVSAINGMFIGASNYLGDAEAGYVAQWFGPKFAVVTGGIGSLIVALVASIASPQLLRYGRIDLAGKVEEEEARKAEEIR